MRNILRLIVVTGALGSFLVGCTLGGGNEQTDGETPEAATTTPEEVGEPETGVAPVDSVDVLLLESFPVQVNVIVSGNLPDGCTRLEEPVIDFDGTTFDITLPTSRPTGVACTEALEPYDKVIPLNVTELPAGDYTVVVNDVSDTFTLQTDNTLGETPTPGSEVIVPSDGSGAISGQVWHDVCAIAGEGGETPVPSAGCVNTSSGGFQADGVLAAGEPGIPGVQVSLGSGACPAVGLATATTDANGFYSFTALAPGAYCVSIDPLVEPNLSLLVPGNWTYPPSDGLGESDVNVAAGQVAAAVNFGWDHQFLPEPGAVTPGAGTATCTDAADFVFDVTIPDDTVISAGSTFTKTWQLINTGDCTWTTDYALVFAGGEQMDGPDETPLPLNVPPGATIDLTVVLTAPTVNGTHRSEWLLRNAQGATFGIPEPDVVFWAQIVVENGTAAPPPTAPPDSTATPAPTATP